MKALAILQPGSHWVSFHLFFPWKLRLGISNWLHPLSWLWLIFEISKELAPLLSGLGGVWLVHFCSGLQSNVAVSELQVLGTPPTDSGFPQFCYQEEERFWAQNLMTTSSQVVSGTVAKTQREAALVKVHSLDWGHERNFQSILSSLPSFYIHDTEPGVDCLLRRSLKESPGTQTQNNFLTAQVHPGVDSLGSSEVTAAALRTWPDEGQIMQCPKCIPSAGKFHMMEKIIFPRIPQGLG